MDFDVFLSYNHADKAFVDRLAKGLDALGLTVFRDSTSLGVYDKLDTKLKLAITNSKYVCAVISPSYLKSYWCLFEAIEAIRNQDLDLRFLPLVLSHNPEDQSLDERFVLDALGDIRDQRQVLEAEIVAHKAYGLHDKLDKLSFIQDFLPKIFSNIQNRVYPRITLWDPESVDKTLADFFEFLAPGRSALAAVAVCGTEIDRNSTVPKFRPKLEQMPFVLWSTFVGIQAWRNKPLVAGDRIFVSSSGENWNAADRLDGVYCLDLGTGAQLWHAHTDGDANEILLSKGLLSVGTDEGELVAFNAQTGARLWSAQFDNAIVSGPIKLPMKHMSSQGRRLSGDHQEGRAVGDRAVIVLATGKVCIIDLDTGNVLEKADLGHAVIGKAKVMPTTGYDKVSIFIPHVGGFLSEISYAKSFADEGNILSPDSQRSIVRGSIRTVDLSIHCDVQMDGYAASTKEIVSIVDNGDCILVGLARDTYANEFPVVSLNKTTLKPNWRKRKTRQSYGNLRAEPLVFDEQVILASAYNNGLAFLDGSSGHLSHDLVLGGELFEQWSSPIASETSVFIGRVDGFFHKVDVAKNKIDWTIYLGHHERSGTTYRGEEHLEELSDSASWNSGSSSPIFSTPVTTNDRLIVGTFEGYLYCIANI